MWATTAMTKKPSVILTSRRLGTGWAGAPTAACLSPASVAANYNNCKVSTAQEIAAERYSAIFPYLSNIDVATNGDFSNYDALQVTFQGRNYHGLSFLSAYTWSHALSVSDGNSVNTSNLMPTDSTNLLLNYGNGNMDLRHRFTFSPTYQIPGLKSPGQMLEGWSVNALVTVQTGFPWNPSDTTTFDWLGTGENGNSGIGLGTSQYWNYSGPKSAFTVNSANPIPCWTEGTVKGCTSGHCERSSSGCLGNLPDWPPRLLTPAMPRCKGWPWLHSLARMAPATCRTEAF